MTRVQRTTFLGSFGHAGRGIRMAARGHRNLRIHLGVALVVLAAGTWLRVTRLEAAVLAVAIGAVLAAELLNSALEEAIDALHPELHPELGRAKDMAAGAVVTVALAAAVAGLVILVPRIPR